MIDRDLIQEWICSAKGKRPRRLQGPTFGLLARESQSPFDGDLSNVGKRVRIRESLAKCINMALQAFRIMDRDTNSLKNGRERGFVASNARQAEISKARWLKTACDMLLELERQRE
jgi:hypothetical protein